MTTIEPIYRGENFGWNIESKQKGLSDFINSLLSKAYSDGQKDILYAIKEGFIKV